MIDFLRTIPLFAELPYEDLAHLCAEAEEVDLAPGQVLFREGDPGDSAFVVRRGRVEIVKVSAGRDVLLAVREQGEVIGEIALLLDEPRSATVRAETATRLVSIRKDRFQHLIDTSPSAARAVFHVLLERWRNTESKLRQSERMVQLGTLTAGLAHELNNPAAAVERAASQLTAAVERQTDAAFEAGRAGMSAPEQSAMAELVARVRRREGRAPLDALARSDAEDEVADWLEGAGVDEAWSLAPHLVDAGFGRGSLAEMARSFEPAHLAKAIRAVQAEHAATDLLAQVEEGARRLSAIVKALKSYVYLDQAPVQDVDVTASLEDTLLIIRTKTSSVTVVREYSDDLPKIEAYGSELNQVWTNLIDNAADALTATGRDDGRIVVRAFPDGSDVVVEIEDNGPGIPGEIRHRIFDAFFTTKAPGQGTGLGLDITYGIVVHRHRGEITVDSEAGRTTFRVTLPREQSKS